MIAYKSPQPDQQEMSDKEECRCNKCKDIRQKIGADTVKDATNPSHYKQHPAGVECIEVVEHFPFNTGNAIKYLWRAGLKTADPKEDLKKALWYIQREINRL